MQLPDFLEFEPFNRLRAKMGAENLGEFDFFDPVHHLCSEELEQLQRDAITIDVASVRVLADQTLAYKNARVVLYFSNQGSSTDVYHLADCVQVKQYRQSSINRGDITYCESGALPQFRNICTECLQKIHYRNYDAQRNRHRDYSQRIVDSFSLREYFTEFPSYPLRENVKVNIF